MSTNSEPPRRSFDAVRRFYRGTLYQAIVLGIVSFTQQGIWTALASMGAGGLASPYFLNAVNVITYVIMIIMSPLFAVLGNGFSLKWILVLGTIGYLPYFGALYCNSVFGTQWFLILGGVTCGFSAAALWTAEAALAIAYPEHHNRGTYIAIWMAIGMVGSVIGSSVQLALNVGNSEQGGVSASTYLIMIGLSCIGLPLSLTIATPQQLRRTDGTKPTFKSGRSTIPLREGLRGLWNSYRSKHIIMLMPIFITVRWSYTYQSNYLTVYFTVGGRALAGFVQVVCGIFATMLWGFLLDSRKVFKSRRTVAAVGWYIMLLVFIVQWAMNFYLQAHFEHQIVPPVIGIRSPEYAKAISAYCLFSVAGNASVVWTYWMLGLFNDDLDTLAYGSGISRSAESIGFAAAYGIGSNSNISLMTNLAISFAVFAASVPITCYVAWKGESLETKEEGCGESNGGVVEAAAEDAADDTRAAESFSVKAVCTP